MSKAPRQIPQSALSLTEQEMDEARARARRKLADERAQAELGVIDANVPVRRGPVEIPDEEEFTLTLNLYEGSDRIILDGKHYMHGQTVTVGKRTYDTLSEIIARGWAHQREIEGKDENAYRKEQNINAITGQPQQFSRIR